MCIIYMYTLNCRNVLDCTRQDFAAQRSTSSLLNTGTLGYKDTRLYVEWDVLGGDASRKMKRVKCTPDIVDGRHSKFPICQ